MLDANEVTSSKILIENLLGQIYKVKPCERVIMRNLLCNIHVGRVQWYILYK